MKRDKNPLISIIIIDYKKDNPLLHQCLDNISKQTYKNFETILLTDFSVDLNYSKLRKKSYGKYVGPAKKRDDGVKTAKGEIVAFIDDDAYPHKNWLKEIVKTFEDFNPAAVGGPGITPPNSSWQEELSGWFSASPIGGGPFTYRFLTRKQIDVDDYPSMNLAVNKDDFLSVGGFDSNYWPGEDTKLCLDLVHKLRKRIIYNPKAIVYHHRRPLWRPHFRQNGNFGIHRGYFARILPETSFRLEYFGPSLMLVGVVYLSFYQFVGSTSALDNQIFSTVYLVGKVTLSLYLLAVFLNGIWIAKISGKTIYGLVSIPITIATHLWYGLKFIQGFLSTRKIENSNQ